MTWLLTSVVDEWKKKIIILLLYLSPLIQKIKKLERQKDNNIPETTRLAKSKAKTSTFFNYTYIENNHKK